MTRRRKPSPHVNHERWLVSYADFITLMFAFFVVMFSSSQVDKRKVGRLAHEMQVAFKDLGIFPEASKYPIPGGDPLNPSGISDPTVRSVLPEAEQDFGKSATVPDPGGVAAIQKQLQTELKLQIEDKDISLKAHRDGLVITLHEVGFFDSGSATVKPGALEALSKIAQALGEHDNPLRIEGHTDDHPIHTSRFDSNWELSTARATEIVKYFIVNRGFRPDRISAAGYAEYHPVAANDTAEGRSQNRRVDIVVLGANAGPIGR
jgi:chemotaxis protein MotB